MGSRRAATFERETSQQVVAVLTQMYLEDIHDPLIRVALEAGSTVRRITCPMLAALMPEAAPRDLYDRLQTLPFVEISKEGLVIHSAVQQAISSSLKAADPERYARYRREAWRFLRTEVRQAPGTEVWRYSADLMYLVETPLVREAYFPSNLQPYAVEPAMADDGPGILAIVERHEGPRSAKLLTAWWRKSPECFFVVRGSDFSVAGFYMLFDPMDADSDLVRSDPIAAAIRQHVIDDPMPKHQRAIAVRRWFDAETGEHQSDVISAIFLELKSYYVAQRPNLRRLYCNCSCYPEYAGLFAHVGFHRIGSV